jgi:hypothetical protein
MGSLGGVWHTRCAEVGTLKEVWHTGVARVGIPFDGGEMGSVEMTHVVLDPETRVATGVVEMRR